ncbi:MAG: hypothetical protein WB689_34755, partial [Xanthobacteraceae bacterium]
MPLQHSLNLIQAHITARGSVPTSEDYQKDLGVRDVQRCRTSKQIVAARPKRKNHATTLAATVRPHSHIMTKQRTSSIGRGYCGVKYPSTTEIGRERHFAL